MGRCSLSFWMWEIDTIETTDGHFVLFKDQNLGSWQVRRQVGSGTPILFKFPAKFTLKAGQRVTVCTVFNLLTKPQLSCSFLTSPVPSALRSGPQMQADHIILLQIWCGSLSLHGALETSSKPPWSVPVGRYIQPITQHRQSQLKLLSSEVKTFFL